MMNTTLLNRSGLAAIAVATALLSTPAFGQEAAPVTVESAPIVADEPLPVEPAPTLEPAPATEAVTDTLAPTEAAPAAPAGRQTRAAAAPTVRAPVETPRIAPPVAAGPAVDEATPAADVSPPVDPAMVAPLPEPVAATAAEQPGGSVIDDDLIPIAGAAGLGILALAGAGIAVRRRRRDDDDAVVEENWHEPALNRTAPKASATPIAASPVMNSASMEKSAFGWQSPPRDVLPQRATPTPLNRIEAAKRGPTPDNPSLSLKKRLKRAAFFDQRDRQVAAGVGTPILATAGLPDSMVAEAPLMAPAKTELPRRPQPGMSMSFGKSFQPA